jgi:hypothetical protein
MPQLRILWVCNNMLFGLPAELAKLAQLVELEADGNVGMQVCCHAIVTPCALLMWFMSAVPSCKCAAAWSVRHHAVPRIEQQLREID